MFLSPEGEAENQAVNLKRLAAFLFVYTKVCTFDYADSTDNLALVWICDITILNYNIIR